jgi:glutamate synthase (NADPH/NADH) large chain
MMTMKHNQTLPAAALRPSAPPTQGLFDPALEKDSCGVGFIADLSNRKSHAIIEHGLTILQNLEHRGAVGADPRAGDGAGILVQIPHRFFQAEAERLGFVLPEPGHYAVGYLFMPRDPEGQRIIRETVARTCETEGQVLLGWRAVPTDNSTLGESVKPTEPLHAQVFIGRGPGVADEDDV